jgi:hypothetical protein
MRTIRTSLPSRRIRKATCWSRDRQKNRQIMKKMPYRSSFKEKTTKL